MGMSTSVIGFVSSDNDIYKKQSKVLLACIEAGISKLPEETASYFGSVYAERYLLEEKLTVEVPVKDWGGDCASGFELNVSDIPSGVTVIRFYNSY